MTLSSFLKKFWPRKIKLQLILGVALVHAFLMTFFILDLVYKERQFLIDQKRNLTYSLSKTIASNTTEWYLSKNINGLQEIISSQMVHQDLDYAMIFDLQGHILAHTDPKRIGKYLTNIKLFPRDKNDPVSIEDDHRKIDIATPIRLNGQTLGWVRVAIKTNNLNNNIYQITLEGLTYTLFAIIFGSIIAYFLGNNLTRKIRQVVEATKKINLRKKQMLFPQVEESEIGELMSNFNNMESKLHQQYQINSEYLKQIESLAFNDSLTGLHNREFLVKQLSKTLKKSAKNRNYSAILFLDIDKFKQLNDSYGHEIGDLLLKNIAKRLKSLIRNEAYIFRFGSDEFVLLYENVGDTFETATEKAKYLAYKIHARLAETYELDELHYKTSVSIGINVFHNQEKTDSDQIIKKADIALYASKEAGRNRITVFENAMESKVKNELILEEGLEKAIENNELFWVIQPQIDMQTQRVIGGEVLLRWRFNDQLISPSDFIPLAEDSLTIIPISNWLFSSVFQFIKQQNLDESISISLNLSPKHFLDNDLIEFIKIQLKHHQINPGQIKMEITEGVFFDNYDRALFVLKKLKKLGLKISLDDFGTGFSSLSYLKNLPIDQLKIDKSFIDELPVNEKPAAIVKTIIDLTKNLSINVIAEGIEDQNQVDFLIENNCHYCQGFYYSKPLSHEAFIDYIAIHNKS